MILVTRSHAPAWECLPRRASGANPTPPFDLNCMEPRSLGETSTRRWRGDTAFPRWRVGTREKPMWVCFSVSDTGIGIAPEMMEVIFKPFTQVDNSSTREYGGTGLGLTISDHFCRAMGGAIVVESELGIGSTFTVQLPTRMG